MYSQSCSQPHELFLSMGMGRWDMAIQQEMARTCSPLHQGASSSLVLVDELSTAQLPCSQDLRVFLNLILSFYWNCTAPWSPQRRKNPNSLWGLPALHARSTVLCLWLGWKTESVLNCVGFANLCDGKWSFVKYADFWQIHLNVQCTLSASVLRGGIGASIVLSSILWARGREAHLPPACMMPECKLCSSISSLLLDWHKQHDKDQNKISSVHQAWQGLSCCSFSCWPPPLLFLSGWAHYSAKASEMQIYNYPWSVGLQSVTIDNRESTKPRCKAVILYSLAACVHYGRLAALAWYILIFTAWTDCMAIILGFSPPHWNNTYAQFMCIKSCFKDNLT